MVYRHSCGRGGYPIETKSPIYSNVTGNLEPTREGGHRNKIVHSPPPPKGEAMSSLRKDIRAGFTPSGSNYPVADGKSSAAGVMARKSGGKLQTSRQIPIREPSVQGPGRHEQYSRNNKNTNRGYFHGPGRKNG